MTIDAVVGVWRIAFGQVDTDQVHSRAWWDVCAASVGAHSAFDFARGLPNEIANAAWFHLRHEP